MNHYARKGGEEGLGNAHLCVLALDTLIGIAGLGMERGARLNDMAKRVKIKWHDVLVGRKV